MRVLVASFVAVMIATAAHAEVRARVDPIDATTALISVAPEKGLKLEKMRRTFLRAASEEALSRGYDWFRLAEVVDRSRQRTVERPGMNGAVSNSGGGYTPLRSGLNLTAGPERVEVIDSGVTAIVIFGNGPRPQSGDTADARTTLALLK